MKAIVCPKEARRHGTTIPTGKPVFLISAAGNRDPRVFTDAHTFDIDRDRSIHSCLGNRRLEPGQGGALERLLDFMPQYEVPWDRLEKGAHAECRGLQARTGEGAAMSAKKKVVVDFGLCEANGICMGIIPEVFDLDEEDYLHVLSDEVTPDNEGQIQEAVRQCPRQAISIVDE